MQTLPLKIAVDGLPLMAVHTGIARYLKSLYHAMREYEGVTVEYALPGRLSPVAPSGATQGGKLDSILSLPPALIYGMRTAQWWAYEVYLGHLARQGKIDIIHESFYTPARFRRNGVKQVFTLHDLSLVKFPQTHSKDRRMFFDRFFQSRLHEADRIIVPSSFVKDELCEFAGMRDSDVVVIPEGVDGHFSPRSRESVDMTLARHGLPSEYVLFVGTLEPRKNLSTLLKALSRMKSDIPLVIVGWSGWGDSGFQEELERRGLRSRLHFPGYLGDEDLAAIYSGATAFLYPSLYEGFGLPVLEAMACGCPVISSNVASLPEVGGNAVILASPDSPEEWADKMDSIVQDSELHARVAAAGLARAGEFSWRSAADTTLELFKTVVTG